MALRTRLRHRITVQRATKSATPNSYGIFPVAWADHLTDIRAWVQPAQRREVEEASEGGQRVARYLVFTLIHDIREGDRIVYGGDTYSIANVDNAAGKDHHLEIDIWRTVTDDTEAIP